jgi:hypothetical protein
MSTNDQLYRKGVVLDHPFGTKSEYSKRETDSVWTL